jgi:hypothetical protein
LNLPTQSSTTLDKIKRRTISSTWFAVSSTPRLAPARQLTEIQDFSRQFDSKDRENHRDVVRLHARFCSK